MKFHGSSLICKVATLALSSLSTASFAKKEEVPANHLINEKSPYLLQHAHNPVDWYPWGNEAFAKAKKENKPIFLSVGYSTCHWCHVMERESFENPAIAKLLNEHFVSIKVDREERPDVDKVYMTFVQATTGGGGWPMNVWLTPELKPFVGGTYFPPAQLTAALKQIAGAWEKDRENVVASSNEILAQLRKMAHDRSDAKDTLPEGLLKKAFEETAASYDEKEGGFGEAPKFPRPVIYDFLSHFYAANANTPEGKKALEMSLFSLRKMAAGGIHDHLGGGFHRYSVDGFWHVPHFEKMLYDQGQLAVAYSRAYQISKEPIFEKTTRDILDYVLRDMTAANGGFFSAEDADSLVRAGDDEHAEGAFYVWTEDEIEKVIGAEKAKVFNEVYGVETNGNAPKDSDVRGEFKEQNILIRRLNDKEVATKLSLSESQVSESLAESRHLLLAARELRPRPRRDDKVITAWNGLMISGFSKAAQVLDEEKYRKAATSAATFLRANLYREKDGVLLRSYLGGASPVEGFAEDYAFLIQGLLDLYETTFDHQWLEWAVKLQERQDVLFWDEKAGGYFSTTGEDERILLRSKEDYDGAEPSPNSIAALNLLRLSKMLDQDEKRKRAEKTIHAFSFQISQVPTAMPEMLVALDWLRAKPLQIVIAGNASAADTQALLREMNRHFIPDKVVLLADGMAGQEFLAAHVEFIKDIGPVDGKAAAYVCENFVCQLPVTKPEELREILER